MKALLLRRYGSPDFLEIDEISTPTPGGNEVLVKVHAISINDWDWAMILGNPLSRHHLVAGLMRPRVIVGSDVAGRVEAVGRNVARFEPGDEVFGDLSAYGFGGCAEFVCAPDRAWTPKSPRMSFGQAAAIPQAGMLALQGVMAGGALKPGQSVLIHGAGGGVGSIAIQLLKLHHVEVTGVDRASKLETMKLWGYDHVVDYAAQHFTRSGKQYDLIVDVKTDRSPADYERALAPHGVYASLGGKMHSLLQVACSGYRPWRARDKTLRVVGLQANGNLRYFNELFESGTFEPVIDSVYGFDEIDMREAFHRFGTSAHTGKIVIRV